MLVEDEEIPKKVIKLILGDMGCTVDTASTGEEAYKYFEIEDYDLIFMDIGLPDLNGLAVAKKMRAYKGRNVNTPIVILSAYSTDKYKNEATSLGLHGFITKPVTPEMCERLLKKHTHFQTAILN